MKPTPTESRKMRRSWARAHARHVNRVEPAPRVDSYRRGGWEHISTILPRVLARIGGLTP